jgi:hypothetical protein
VLGESARSADGREEVAFNNSGSSQRSIKLCYQTFNLAMWQAMSAHCYL